MMKKLQVGIIGAAGLSGLELLVWLKRHPNVNVRYVTSERYAGKPVSSFLLQYSHDSLLFSSHEVDFEQCDLCFLAIPNQASLALVPKLMNLQKIRVIDLSGVYRLKTAQRTEIYYQLLPQQSLLDQAVFGLPEIYAQSLKNARLVANPGCFPTAPLLALWGIGELLQELSAPPIIDAKTGVSGAGGRVENSVTNYVDVNENCQPL